MTLSEVLAEISNRGVKLGLMGEQLRGRLTRDLRNALAENNREYPI
ncbi:MAG: hypothetical protein ACREYE_02000 [Gammaproteobacteria bacterium]